MDNLHLSKKYPNITSNIKYISAPIFTPLETWSTLHGYKRYITYPLVNKDEAYITENEISEMRTVKIGDSTI